MELTAENIPSMLEKIPTFSQSAIRILEITADVNCAPKDLVGQISHDPILTARVLKLVNSAYFGLSRKVESIQQSVVYVGINTIKNLAISVAAMGALPRTNEAGLDMSNFWTHSLITAVIAKLVAQKVGVARTEVSGFFISGLLHDIGQIIFSTAQPEAYAKVLKEAREMQKPLHVLEQEEFGINHAELGAMLAEKWQLPASMVCAIRQHHDPEKMADDEITGRAVFVANQISKTIDEQENQLSVVDTVPESIQSWIQMPLNEVAASLPGLQDEIDSAKVFIQLSG